MQYVLHHHVSPWCIEHLGAPSDREALFVAGRTGHTIGLRLRDGREVVVRIRLDEPRSYGLASVQRHLHAACYPCPALLAGPAPVRSARGWMALAEEYVPGEHLSGHPDRASSHAAALAWLLQQTAYLQPLQLDPPPAHVRWSHSGRSGVWAPCDGRLRSARPVPDWARDAGRRLRARLACDTSPRVIGHAGWEARNVRWADGGRRLHAVYGWDDLAIRREALIAGAAAARYVVSGDPHTVATAAQAEAFLDAYEEATKRRLGLEHRQACWAAALWVRTHYAIRDDRDGHDAPLARIEEDSASWLARAGA